MFLSFYMTRKVARGMRQAYFFTLLITFHARISSLTKPVIAPINAQQGTSKDPQLIHKQTPQNDMVIQLYIPFTQKTTIYHNHPALIISLSRVKRNLYLPPNHSQKHVDTHPPPSSSLQSFYLLIGLKSLILVFPFTLGISTQKQSLNIR